MHENEKAGWRVIAICFLVVPAFVLAVLWIRPPFGQRAAERKACVNNLRQLAAAKEQWSVERQVAKGTAASTNEILLGYVPENRLPVCPKGGRYDLRRLGEPPTCTVPGHSL